MPSVMGDIPAHDRMVSSIITLPAPGQDIPANKSFSIQIKVWNLGTGQFTNPANTYFTSPQQLDDQGLVRGHVHVTIQDMGGSFTPSSPLEAKNFVMFKGVNNVGAADGSLSAVVKEGLPKGYYRVCTMTAASNHQPVIMPVAQRGSQDDCTKFSVGLTG
jgi:transcription initiation factor TFIID subunit 15